MCSTFDGFAVMMPWTFPGRQNTAEFVGQLLSTSVDQSRKRCRFLKKSGKAPTIGYVLKPSFLWAFLEEAIK